MKAIPPLSSVFADSFPNALHQPSNALLVHLVSNPGKLNLYAYRLSWRP